MQIIACGNPECGDDAAGWLVAGHLGAMGLEAVGASIHTCAGQTTELLNILRSDEDLILVDAVVTGAPAGSLHHWDGVPTVASPSASSTHGLGVAEALRLARVLGRAPRSLRVYGIEGRQFAPGAPPSPEVMQAAERLAQQIHATIEAERALK